MTETLTGKQVLALLAQDEPPEIEFLEGHEWSDFYEQQWFAIALRETSMKFRIKPKPARRLSVTLANGQVVSWPEPVREALEYDKEYWCVDAMGDPMPAIWASSSWNLKNLAFGNVHLTREAAHEHAVALRKINCQEVGKC